MGCARAAEALQVLEGEVGFCREDGLDGPLGRGAFQILVLLRAEKLLGTL